MKRIVLLTLLFIFALCASAYAAPSKLGFVDRGYVLEQSEPGKAIISRFKGKLEAFKKTQETKIKEIERLRDELQKQSMALSLEAKQEKEIQFKRKIRDAQDEAQREEQKLMQERNKELTNFNKVLTGVVEAYGKKNDFAAVFEINPVFTVYVDQAVNLNSVIIQELNAAWKTQGSKP